MTPTTAAKELRLIARQRNIAVLLLGVALISIVILAVFSTAKRDRLILMPLTAHPTTIEAGHVRRDYLRELAISISYFFENLTPETTAFYEERILAVTHPSARGQIAANLSETVERWQGGSTSRAWYPREVYEDPSDLYAEVTGEVRTFVGTQRVETKNITVAMTFIQDGYSVFLKEIEEIDPQEARGKRLRAEAPTP